MYISTGLPNHDSAQTAIATEKTLETGKLHGITEGRYGYILINVIAYLVPHFIFGVESSEFTINFVTILFASLSVAVLYLFAKELLNNKYMAFSSSLLFSFTPIYLSVTTDAKSHAHSIFFILLSAYFLVRLIKTDSLIYKVVFSLTLGFSLFVRVSDVFVSLPLFLLLLMFPKKFLSWEEIRLKKFNTKNLLPILLPLLFMLILLLIFQGSAIDNEISGNKFFNVNWALVSNISLAIFLFMPSLALFLVIYGFFRLIKENKPIALLLVIWSLGIFIFYSSFATAKLRFFVVLLVPSSIFMGVALNAFREKQSIFYFLILIIVLALMFSLVHPYLAYKHNHSSEKESALYIASITESNAIIFDAGDSSVFYDYYTDRKIIGCLFADKPKEFNEKIALINNALESSIPVYMSSQCFSLAKGEDTQFSLLWEILRKNYEWAEVGKIYKENPEGVVYIYPKEYAIYKLRKKQN